MGKASVSKGTAVAKVMTFWFGVTPTEVALEVKAKEEVGLMNSIIPPVPFAIEATEGTVRTVPLNVTPESEKPERMTPV